MSDLQCPARLVILNPPGLGDVSVLAARLRDEAVVAVHLADGVEGLTAALSLAEQLGVPTHTACDDLTDGSPGWSQVVDLHRGETVVLVRSGTSHSAVLTLVDADGQSTQPL